MTAARSTSVTWFIAYRFLGACLPYLSVASLCLAARGMAWSEVLELGALYAIASAALVLPVSALAQKVGPRAALVGGALAVAVGASLAAVATDVASMAVAQLAFAIAAAVDAGVDSAYLWGLVGHDRDAYRAAEARSTAGRLAGGVVGISLGGALLVWSPAAPFAAAAVFALAAAACASRLAPVELPAGSLRARSLPTAVRPDGQTTATSSGGSVYDVAGATRALVTAAGGMRWLAIGLVSCAVARVMASAAGPLLADAGFTGRSATAVATAAAIVAAVAAGFTAALRGADRKLALFVGAPVVLAASAIGLASAHGAAAAMMIAVGPIMAGVLAPLWRAHLNQQAPADAPRLLLLAIDATVVRVIAAALSLLSTGAAPRASVAALGIGLAIVLGLAVLRDRRLRVAAIAAVALLTPQLAGAATERAWTQPAPELCVDELVVTKPLGAGSTIKFKAKVGEAKVVLRPAQVRDAGNYKADVAAYEVARLLGLSTVPYGCLRRIDRASLEAVAGDALKLRLAEEIAWDADGTVAVSIVRWVDGVSSANLEATRTAWRAQLAQAQVLTTDAALAAEAAEGSRLAVWDFLIANWDRWSGGNTFRLGADYVWLDNAAGFGRELARTRNARAAKLRATERFSRTLVTALRSVDDAALAQVLGDAGLAPARVAEVLTRKELVLAHVDALVATHGEDAVLAFE
jgi:hypothetical protein